MAVYTNHLYLQFSQAAKLEQLIDGLAPYLIIDETEFYYNYFDIDTCNTQGLDNWGRLLNIGRTSQIPDLDNCLGFFNGDIITDDVSYPQNFEQGNFWGGQVIVGILNDTLYRSLLRFRYSNLTTNATLGSANIIMNTYAMSINPDYKIAVTQTDVMEITFTLNWTLQANESFIFNQRNLMPVPLGVSYTIVQGASL